MLELDHINFAYPHGNALLHDVSLSVKPACFTALLGKNGCGKSTILSLIMGILHPASGTITLDGEDLPHMERGLRAKKICMVAQREEATHNTVFDAVLMGRKPYIESAPRQEDFDTVADILARLSLSHHALSYMDELSGGERQVATLARAFVQQTDYLLLDEPTNNLDPYNQQEIMQLVHHEVNDRGIGALAVMHDINLALQYCDRFILMKEGSIKTVGDSSVITKATIRDIYGMKVDVITHNGTRVVIPHTLK